MIHAHPRKFTIANACYGGACRSQLFAFALQEQAKTSHLRSVGYLCRVAESLIDDDYSPKVGFSSVIIEKFQHLVDL
jgi:hypothetical protein